MEMHAAALPPRQPHISAEDRRDPLFPEYQRLRASFSANLIEAPSFADWKRLRADEQMRDDAAAHPSYPAFVAWCRETQAGRRRCPAGTFPANFHFWIEGGRW